MPVAVEDFRSPAWNGQNSESPGEFNMEQDPHSRPSSIPGARTSCTIPICIAWSPGADSPLKTPGLDPNKPAGSSRYKPSPKCFKASSAPDCSSSTSPERLRPRQLPQD